MITIAIVEDNLVHALALESIINKLGNCQILTVQSNGFTFLEYCSKHHQLPAIAIVDVQMPVMDGVSLTDYLAQYYPTIKVIAFSAFIHVEAIEDMLACGAKGYLCKLQPSHWGLIIDGHHFFHLQEAIEAVANGNYYIDTHLTQSTTYKDYVFDIPSLVAKRVLERETAKQIGFTEREIKSSTLYATATVSQADIANVLSLSSKTVEKQLQAASNKLDTKTRHAFAINSIAWGLVKIASGFRRKR